jgi:hypothetical protein
MCVVCAIVQMVEVCTNILRCCPSLSMVVCSRHFACSIMACPLEYFDLETLCGDCHLACVSAPRLKKATFSYNMYMMYLMLIIFLVRSRLYLVIYCQYVMTSTWIYFYAK